MKGTERAKYIRFLYWLDDNFTERVHNLSFDEIVDEYLADIDSNLISIDDVTVVFESDSPDVELNGFEFVDQEDTDSISGE